MKPQGPAIGFAQSPHVNAQSDPAPPAASVALDAASPAAPKCPFHGGAAWKAFVDQKSLGLPAATQDPAGTPVKSLLGAPPIDREANTKHRFENWIQSNQMP